MRVQSCGFSVFGFPCYDTRKAYLFDSKGQRNKTVAAQIENQLGDGLTCLKQHWWVCDGNTQCASNIDESKKVCSECPPNWIKCGDYAKCVPEKRQCDGVDDCGNGFDEQNCVCKGVHHLCTNPGLTNFNYLGCGSFDTCKGVHPCFPYLPTHESRSYCDGYSGMRCSKKQGYHNCFDDMGLMRCIGQNLICDGVPHCANATDEDAKICRLKGAAKS